MKRSFVVFLILLAAASICNGREIVVNSIADSGAGTLRWALQTARSGDVVTFDPVVFSPTNPATILPQSELPSIGRPRRRITIDASNAGVIIDGSNVPGELANGLQIYTDDCVVMGLQIMNFASCGIIVGGGSRNVIGGDRSFGAGPIGQGNLLAHNAFGIDLCSGGSGNVITGNIIGTDATLQEILGHRYFGIYIEDGISHTIIGPNNYLAYNHIGIGVDGSQATGNAIFENTFLKIDTVFISLRGGANGQLAAPFVGFADPSSGLVRGSACPNCTVQIYTFDEKGISAFEGAVVADDCGKFVLTKEAPLNGDLTIATATDIQGNTSELSNAMGGSVTRIQVESAFSSSRLPTFPSAELYDNHIGVFFNRLYHAYGEPGAFPDHVLDSSHILGLGAKKARFSINSSEYQRVDWSKPELSIDPDHDVFIADLAEAGVALTLVMSFWDTESISDDRTVPTPRFKTEGEIERYLDFVRFVVGHFEDRIERYEIWNEPSLPDESIQSIEVQDYLRLVKRVVPVIRDVYPGAKIVVGGTHSLIDEDSQQYLYQILISGLMPLVDVVSWHPMYGSSPECDWGREYYFDYPAIVRDIKSVALAHGFRGEFVADEIHWCTHDLPSTTWPTYSEMTSAKYYLRGTLMNLGLDVSVTQILLPDKPTLLDALRNLNTVMSAHESIDMPVEINIETDDSVATCSFRYPNGDRVLAIWTDGIAQDEDPGIPATIAFPNLAAGAVTGIDLLHGLEQELVFEIDGEDTVVRDLLVKDYPILIRFSDVTFGPGYVETVGDGFHQLGEPCVDTASDRDGDGVPNDEDFCSDWLGSAAASGC